MKTAPLSLILPIIILFAVILGCDSDGRSSSGSTFTQSGSSYNVSKGNLSIVARVKIGPASLGIGLDENGQIKFDFKLVKEINLGLFKVDFGVQEARKIANSNPDKHYLFIIVEDDAGETKKFQYDIGEEFDVTFYEPKQVRVIGKNSSTIIIVKSPKLFSAKDKSHDNKNFVVDTANNSGLNLRVSKNISSDSLILIPEAESVSLLHCANELETLNGRDGRWCKVKYNGKIGWVWGWYIREKHRQTKSYSNTSKNDTYFVKTRNNSGLYLRAEKNLESDWTTFVGENQEVDFLFCEDELVYVKEREGRWCKVSYKGKEGWAWGWYLHKKTN